MTARRGVRRWRGLLVALAAITMLSTSCTSDSDWGVYNSLLHGRSMSSFLGWWKGEHAKALHVSVATIDRYWDEGHGRLDKDPARNMYFDVSTNFCSYSPDTGPTFDFKAPCARHDFAWRNLKKLDRRWGSHRNTVINRMAGNFRFLADTQNHCSTRALWLQPSCIATANGYYAAVVLAAA